MRRACRKPIALKNSALTEGNKTKKQDTTNHGESGQPLDALRHLITVFITLLLYTSTRDGNLYPFIYLYSLKRYPFRVEHRYSSL